MSAYDYRRLLNSSIRLIDRFGDDANVVFYEDVPASDPWLPPMRTKITTPVRAAFIKATEKHADNSDIHIGDQLVLIAGNCPRNLTNIVGTIERGKPVTETWKIVKIVPVKPGPTIVLYKIKVEQ